MASLQRRGDGWRVAFRYLGKQHTFALGKVSETEGSQWRAKAEHLLMRINQGLLEVPRGVSVADFVLHDGKPPVDPEIEQHKQSTLHELREAYLETHSNGAIEINTLYTARIHLNHIEKTLGKRFLLAGLTLGKLQGHINRRQSDASPVTIKKELDTFRSVWNFGKRMKWVDQPFPSSGLVYPKTAEKLPFMTWAEIERRIKAGGDADILWECLYLDSQQTTELLAYVRSKKVRDWIYPMIAAAAHTGARRSELLRARVEDVDLDQRVLTIREKKRAKGTSTTRRVPISDTLAAALKPLMKDRAGKPYVFGTGNRELSVQATQKAFVRVLQGSKWDKIRGWHVLRHGFISACANKAIDQRLIDEWVGHQTPAMRARYRHIYPSVSSAALASVFS